MNSVAIRLARVLPGQEPIDMDSGPVADHLRDGDRLAQRAPEPEHGRGGHPGRGGGQHDAADDLPARGAERRGPVLELLGTVRNRSRLSAATIGSTITVSPTPAVKRLRPVVWGAPNTGMKPSTLCSNGSTCFATNGASTIDAPEPDDDARDGRQHLDQRPHDRADRRRRHHGQVQADRDPQRRRDHQRDESGDDGAVDQRRGAEARSCSAPTRNAPETRGRNERSTGGLR